MNIKTLNGVKDGLDNGVVMQVEVCRHKARYVLEIAVQK